jgi:hypothetical protein
MSFTGSKFGKEFGMGDDFSKKGPPDSGRVNLDERWERSYWARRLGVTDQELREAIALVGPLAEDVKTHFASRPR